MSWERIMAVGCSHACYADPKAITATLEFKKRWKPKHVIHLGDAFDCTAFMSSHMGQGGGRDEIEPDIDSGLLYLEQLRPNVFLWGNHEHRLIRLTQHRNDIVRFAAANLVERLETRLTLLKAKSIQYLGNDQDFTLGRVRFMHGTVYNENATRDHAGAFAPYKGALVHAHTHRPGMARGRRADNPLGYCVGTLTRRSALEYANTRLATLAWGQAILWGEINTTTGTYQLWLHEHNQEEQEWRLPV